MITATERKIEELTTPAKACHNPEKLRHLTSTVLSNRIAESITAAPMPPKHLRIPKTIELYVERYCRCDDESESTCDYPKPKFSKSFRSEYPKNTSLIYHVHEHNKVVDSLAFCMAIKHCDYCDGALIDKEVKQEIKREAFIRLCEKQNMLSPMQIRSIREELGFSREAFAKMLGISGGCLQMRELGKSIYSKAFSEQVANIVRNWGRKERNSQVNLERTIKDVKQEFTEINVRRLAQALNDQLAYDVECHGFTEDVTGVCRLVIRWNDEVEEMTADELLRMLFTEDSF